MRNHAISKGLIMSTLQRIEAISKELSEMADKEDFTLVYGPMVHAIRRDIERHGYSEHQAANEVKKLLGPIYSPGGRVA